MFKTSIGSTAIALLLIPLGAVAQQHASAHIVQYHDAPAGRTSIAGPPVLLVFSPDPEYTEAARTGKVTGAVVMEGTLGTDGCVRGIRILRTLGYGLDGNAVYAVQRWKFEPPHTQTTLRIEVNFDPTWSPDKASLPKKKCGEK
ncbi:MAG: energy transducer TonB [Terriglobales bacterium]